MTLRKLPGALALGTPAALLAHVALFGGSHTVGGSLHDLVLYGTLATAALFALILGLLAWRGASATSMGSVIAGRLQVHLASPAAIFCSAAVTYAAIESLEPQHNPANVALLVCALLAATLLLHAAAQFAIRAFATIAIAIISNAGYDGRASYYIPRLPQRFVFAAEVLAAYRRFARPPPSFA